MSPNNQKNIGAEIKFSSERLPEGWEKVTLADVGMITTGNTPPRKDASNYGDTFPWVKPSDLDRDGFVTKTEEYLSEKGGRKARLLPSGTAMVSCIGNLGKVGIAGTTLATNQQINSITFSEGLVDSKYGFFYCKTLKDWLEANASATTITIINKNRFSQAPFLLAPLAEQKRIAARVEELLARVSGTKERLAKVKEILKRFRQSVLSTACSGRLTEDWREKNSDGESAYRLLQRIQQERRETQEHRVAKRKINENVSLIADGERQLPETWVWVKLSDLLHYSRAAAYGVLQPGPDQLDGVPMVRVCDIQNGKVLVDQLKRIAPEIEAQYRRTRLQGGEVLVTLVGSIGRTAVVPQNALGANVARAVAMLPLCPHVTPNFIQYTLAEPKKNEELVELSREVARKTLNLGLLKAVEVPLAPIAEQRQIVHRAESLLKLTDAIEKRVEIGTAQAEKLTQAILAKAFRGELVPTEAELARREARSYEPASTLLAKIKAQNTCGAP